MQEPSVSSDASPDPRTSLSRAIATVADGGELEEVLERTLTVAAEALGAAMGAIFVSDPDRAILQLVSTFGLSGDAETQLATEATDAADPFAVAATERTATFDAEVTRADGSRFTGSYLPLIVSAGGVATAVGSIGLRWP